MIDYSALAFDPATRFERTHALWFDDPWDDWREARVRTFARRQWIFWLTVVGFVALLARGRAAAAVGRAGVGDDLVTRRG